MNVVQVPWAAWYGDGQHALSFPESWTVSIHAMSDGPAMSARDIEAVIARAIEKLNAAKKAPRRLKKAVIAVGDLTRPTPTWQVLRPLLAGLDQWGLGQDRIEIVVALGNHRALVSQDLEKILGRQVASQIPVRNHSPFGHLVQLGRSASGIPIEVNRTFAEADLKLAITSILPHNHVGFSGGGKIVLPGLSAIDSVYQFHKIRPTQSGDGRSQDGPVDRSDIRREVRETAERTGLDLVLNAICNSKREVTGLFVGERETGYLAGVEMAQSVYATLLPSEVDVAVLNAYPKDTEFYQVLNAVQILQRTPGNFVNEAGTVVLTTAASEGRGVHYLFGPDGKAPYTLDPRQLTGGRRILIYSPTMSQAAAYSVFPTGIEFFGRWQDLLERLQALHGKACRVAVLPCASIQTPMDGG